MASTDTPRFFKAFISQFSSDSMLIPVSYNDELPRYLPKTAILQGTGGCVWQVAMKLKQEEVYFEQGWSKFVKDNSLVDGDFLTFVYNGDRIFEVSIYGLDGCKEVRAVTEVMDDEEDSVSSLNSDDTDTDSNSTFEFERANTIPRSKNKGKDKKEVVESSDEDSDSDYVEEFGLLDLEEDSSSDSSYAPRATHVKPKVTNPKKKGKSKLKELGDSSCPVQPVKKTRERVKTIIENPEAYLDDPKNIYFETGVKNRKYELLVHAQLVKDYCLRFRNYTYYIHPKGKLVAKTTKWKDQRVCIKRWISICEMNKLKKQDRVVCELLRKKDLVYAVKIHIVRQKYLV